MDEDQETSDAVEGANTADQARYKPWATKTVDTVTIMNCKVWACRALQCVCTVRVDLRMSKLLRTYKDMFDDGVALQPHVDEASLNTLKARERLNVSMQVLKIPQIQDVSITWL